MCDGPIKPPNTSDNTLPLALSYIGNKTIVKFDGDCLKQDKTTFTHGKSVNIYIACEINLWNYVESSDPTLGNSLFGAIKLKKKNADIEKFKYSGNGIGFDMKGTFEFPTIGFGRNVITFGVDMSSLDILIIRKRIF